MGERVYLVLCYFCFLRTNFLVGGEPKCSKFDYEEQMLEKMIRTEIKVEQMKTDIEEALKNMKQYISDATREANEQRVKITEALDSAESRTKEQTENLSGAVTAAESALKMAKEGLRVPLVLFKSRKLEDLTPSVNTILKFQTIMYNFGNGYDNTTGIFTAPVNGTYLFTAQLCIYDNNYSFYGIYVDDTLVTLTSDYDYDGGSPCNTADALVLLTAGDNVFLKTSPYTSSRRLVEGHYRWNTFSGVLLHE